MLSDAVHRSFRLFMKTALRSLHSVPIKFSQQNFFFSISITTRNFETKILQHTIYSDAHRVQFLFIYILSFFAEMVYYCCYLSE